MIGLRFFLVICLMVIGGNLDAMSQDWEVLLRENVSIKMPDKDDLIRRFNAGGLGDLVPPKTTIIEQFAFSESSAEIIRIRFVSCLAENGITRADQIKFLGLFKVIICDMHQEALETAKRMAEEQRVLQAAKEAAAIKGAESGRSELAVDVAAWVDSLKKKS